MSRTSPILELRGESPQSLIVRDVTEEGSPHRRAFGVIADYGWAERIVATGMSKDDANDVARVMAEKIGCRAELA